MASRPYSPRKEGALRPYVFPRTVGRPITAAGRWLTLVAGDLRHLLLPPRCPGCQAPQDHGPVPTFCPICRVLLVPNDGPRCRGCDQPGPRRCQACRRTPSALRAVRAPYVFVGALATYLRRLKLGPEPALGAPLAALLSDDAEARALARDATAVVPVPAVAARLRQRGIDHARALAGPVAAAWGLPHRPLLRRRGGAPPQRGLALAARRRNVQDQFVATHTANGTFLLVDDVVTSGATLQAAAQALLRAGATAVVGLAIARTVQDT